MSEVRIYDRVSRSYHDEVISPFASDVEFRLSRDLDGVVSAWKRDRSLASRVAIDFGCGIGEAISLVAGRVGLAIGLDFSPGMLKQTRQRLRGAGRSASKVHSLSALRGRIARVAGRSGKGRAESVLVRGNFLRMKTLRESCDLAIAVNSIAGQTKSRTYRMFEGVVECLAPGGRFFGVFPAFDAMVSLLRLHRKAGYDDGLVSRLDLVDGVYRDDDAIDLKCVTPEELRQLVSLNGLDILRLEKIRYPWPMMRRYGWGYYPNAPRLWDWYLSAKKPSRIVSES